MPMPVLRLKTPRSYPSNSPAARVAPRIIRLITLFKKPDDRGIGDTVDRWLKARFAQKKNRLTNTRFTRRLNTGCACQSRVEVLNLKYPFIRSQHNKTC
jgi:hypothetical protein